MPDTDPANVVWYHDSIDAATGEYRRALLIPRGAVDIVTADPLPDFMREPDPDCGWQRIPTGAIAWDAQGAAGYQDGSPPVSLPDLAARNFTVHYEQMGETPGLQQVIQDYKVDDVPIAPDIPVLLSARMRNRWIIINDSGANSAGFEVDWREWGVEFDGCQREQPTIEGEITPGVSMSEQMTIISTAQVVMDSITMIQVCATVAATELAGPYTDLTILAWGSPGAFVRYASVQPGQVFYGFKIDDLFAAAQELCEAVLVRLERGVITWAAESTAFIWRHTSGDTGFAHPYSNIINYGHAYDAAYTRGSALASGDRYLIGEIREESDTSLVGGLLHPTSGDGGDTLATDTTLYSWLKDRCSFGTMCRCSFVQVLPNIITVNFYGDRESVAGAIPLALSNIVLAVGDNKPAPIKHVRSSTVMANATASIRCMGTGDKTQSTSRQFGSLSEAGLTAEIAFHTTPSVGDGKAPGDVSADDFHDPLDIADVRYTKKLFDVWNIFYLGDPFGTADAPIPICAHASCDIVHAPGDITAAEVSSTIELPSFVGPVIDSITSLLAQVTIIQTEAGLLIHVPIVYTSHYGDQRQTQYTILIPMEYAQAIGTATAGYNTIGGRYLLSPVDDLDHHSAQVLANLSSVDARAMFGALVLTSVEPHFGSGDEKSAPHMPLCQCKFLGVGF